MTVHRSMTVMTWAPRPTCRAVCLSRSATAKSGCARTCPASESRRCRRIRSAPCGSGSPRNANSSRSPCFELAAGQRHPKPAPGPTGLWGHLGTPGRAHCQGRPGRTDVKAPRGGDRTVGRQVSARLRPRRTALPVVPPVRLSARRRWIGHSCPGPGGRARPRRRLAASTTHHQRWVAESRTVRAGRVEPLAPSR